MRHRLLLRAALAALAFAWAALPSGPAAAGETPVEPPVATVIPASETERNEVFDTLAKADAEKSNELRVRALTTMASRRHLDFVPEIRKYVEDANQEVQAAAILAAAAHDLKDEEKRVRKVLRSKPKQKTGTGTISGLVAAACIDYLARLDIQGEAAFVLDEWLRNTLTDERRMKQSWAPDVIRAAVLYVGKSKLKQAVPFLIEEMVAEPVPANPNDPKNPPATYWEARHTLWVEYEGWARWALKEITGQQYRSIREWQAWLKQQDKKAFK